MVSGFDGEDAYLWTMRVLAKLERRTLIDHLILKVHGHADQAYIEVDAKGCRQSRLVLSPEDAKRLACQLDAMPMISHASKRILISGMISPPTGK
jgi:hypothetical protein